MNRWRDSKGNTNPNYDSVYGGRGGMDGGSGGFIDGSGGRERWTDGASHAVAARQICKELKTLLD